MSARTWWWLSFVDRLADGEGNTAAMHLGVSVVHGDDLGDAISWAWRSGCNPGGEVVGVPLPDWDISPAYTYRLCRDAELDELQAEVSAARARTEAGQRVHP